MRTLDIFRTSVAAAALGFARRALDEAVSWPPRADVRRHAGRPSSLRPRWREMATDDRRCSAADLPRRLAARPWAGASPARLRWPSSPPPSAQQVIDAAVQLHGGLRRGQRQPVERLYREIRALRIYEGASEVQRLIVGRETLAAADAQG
jgi:acyl-CoA dehydrogenase